MMTLSPPDDRLRLAAIALWGSAIVLMAGASLIYGASIAADRLPMQWGLDGAPTWFAPRLYSLWGLVVVATIVGGALAFAGRRQEQRDQSLWWSLIVFTIMQAAAHAYHLYALVRWAGA